MVNGQICLGDHQAAFYLYGMLRRIPVPSLSKLFYVITGLQNRIKAATDGIEAFCYEDHSRSLWAQCNRGNPVSVRISGVPGVEQLGSNHIQRMWMTYNLYEDIRIQDQTLWQMAKMVVSAQSPKGVEKMDRRDRQIQQTEQERRQKVRDEFFYRSMGILKGEKTTDRAIDDAQEIMGMPVVGPKSEEELVREMRNWVEGNKDWHDEVVEDYKNAILERQRMAEEERHRLLLDAQRDAQLKEGGDPGTIQLVGYTAQQLQMILQKKEPIRPGVRTLYEDVVGRRKYLTDKYLESETTSGVLRVEGDELVGDPDIPDLNSRIASRRVSMAPDGPME